jgi:peptide/nickel transport system permease protein
MVSTRRLQDKYNSWKKLFLQNWTLFKASRIGVVGLAIMIAFLLVALLVPVMGLRDPLYWLAPESDTISVQRWWSVEVVPGSTTYGLNGSVDHAVAFRLSPAAFEPRADRIYVPEGPHLFAFRTSDANWAWTDSDGDPRCTVRGADYYFVADDVISVDPVIVNYGSHRDPADAMPLLMFGTRAGTVYVMRDDILNTRCPTPLTTNLGSPITGLAALTTDQSAGPLIDRDGFVVGTEDGRLFGFTVNGTSGGFYRELWNTQLDLVNPAPIHIAGAVIRTTSGSPVSSPAYYQSIANSTARAGEAVYVGDTRGVLYKVWTSNGTISYSKALISGGTTWIGAPVVSPAAELTGTLPTLVYATVQDRESNLNVTKVYVLTADTLARLDSWDASGDGGLPIAFRGVERGIPNTPAVVGTSIFVTTSTGWLYNIIRDPIYGENNVLKVPPGSVQWGYQDLTFKQDATHHTSFTSTPYIFENLKLVVAAASYNNGTASPADDIGIVYVFGEASGSLTWKKTFLSGLLAMPVAWRDPTHVREAVWFGTVRGDVYSYSTSGQYLAPLSPSWAHEYLDQNGVWHNGYPSGNTYVLGTDARGRDIFSQLIWGSRVALLVGFASAFFTISIGVIVGLVAGYLGGRVESILMRFTDVILVIPGLPLVIILAAVLGAGIGNIILVIAFVGWPGVARVIRAEVLSLKERPFIDSARVTGASNVRIMFRHVAPNVAPLAFLYMTFAVSGAILTEAALSFIGLGDVNTISWGIMLQDVSQSKALQAWWWLLPPGLAITMISLAFFLVGRAFDEIVNPRLRKR